MRHMPRMYVINWGIDPRTAVKHDNCTTLIDRH